jgi:excisionase family DNA binding protein
VESLFRRFTRRSGVVESQAHERLGKAGASPSKELRRVREEGRLSVEPLAVDVRTAASLTSLSARTIRRFIQLGRLRAVRAGRRVLVPLDSLRALLHAEGPSAGRDLGNKSGPIEPMAGRRDG